MSCYGFCQTETCDLLTAVNASRCQLLHRFSRLIPAMRAFLQRS